MQIKIAERLRPFSHTPGTFCLLPGSSYRLQIFPALIRIDAFSENKYARLVEIPLNIQGPLNDFTVQVDLEKGKVNVWGFAKNGYLRYSITAVKDKKTISIDVDKSPVDFSIPINEWITSQKEGSENSLYTPPLTERLSLGNNKKQDWDFIRRRIDLTEILPHWVRFGHLVNNAPSFKSNSSPLLSDCQEFAAQRDKLALSNSLRNLFLAGFHGILCPRVDDDQYQGIHSVFPESTGEWSPLTLLIEGSTLIRELFLKQKNSDIFILPLLLPEFHCGRLIQVKSSNGVMDIEWTKKNLRQMIFFSSENQSLHFHFPKELKQFRLRQGNKDKGRKINCGQEIEFKQNLYYLFDNFER